MNKKSNKVQTGNFTHQQCKKYTSLHKHFNSNLTQKHHFQPLDSIDSTPTKQNLIQFAKSRHLYRCGSEQQLKGSATYRQNDRKMRIVKQKNCFQSELEGKQLNFLSPNQNQKIYGIFGLISILRTKNELNCKTSRIRLFQDKLKQQDLTIKKKQQQTVASNSSSEKKIKKIQHIPSFFKLKKNSLDSQIISSSINDFIRIKKLGEGKFGQVYLVREKYTNFIMAMKILEKNKLLQSGFMEQFIRELKVQAYLNHPNIIKLFGFFHDENNIYILLENGCDGQLYDLLKQKKTLSEGTTSYITKSLLQGVNYMHRNKILHRDIKPQNIVLSHGTVKICDFGWAVHNKSDLRNTYCGTPLYFSPELLKGKFYDQKVDVWAIGIMAFQLHLGRSPFNISQKSDLYKIITDPIKLPLKDTSTKYREFICSILQKNPQKRLSCQELLKLPFITYYEDLQVYEELI